jgi:hypothetical protein
LEEAYDRACKQQEISSRCEPVRSLTRCASDCQRDDGRVRQRPHEEEAIKSGEIGKGLMKENSSTSSTPAAERPTSAAHDELMAALLTTDKAGLRRLVADNFALIPDTVSRHRTEGLRVRAVRTVRSGPRPVHRPRALSGTARPRTSLGVPLSLRFMADSPGPNRRQAARGNKHHPITEGNIAHVTRPRPQLLHLARRLWHR